MTAVFNHLGSTVSFDILRLIRATMPDGKELLEHARQTLQERDEELRSVLPNSGRPWTNDDDAQLLLLHAQEKELPELMQILGRTSKAIRARLLKLTDPAAHAALQVQPKAPVAQAEVWAEDDDLLLTALAKAGKGIDKLEIILQRPRHAIEERLKYLKISAKV